MKIGQHVTLVTERHAITWTVTGIDVYGPSAARFRCYLLERGETWLRLTERELAMNGARAA